MKPATTSNPMFRRITTCLATTSLVLAAVLRAEPEPASTAKADGYRGIWFALNQRSEHGDKYSGGLGTYTANHVPIAVYAPAVEKTFFVWGGTPANGRGLLIMASYYDHRRGVVPRPTIVRDGAGFNDPHANPSISIDAAGHVWVFAATRHRFEGRKYRSRRPYCVDEFTLVESRYIAYPQPWLVSGRGMLLLFTQYTRDRNLYWQTTTDNATWSEPRELARFGGHYQTSGHHQGTIGTAFNFLQRNQADTRTNLYYVQSRDFGATWTTAAGQALTVPLASPDNPALIRDFRQDQRLVYIHDLNFDAAGRPVVLFLTSAHHAPGPQSEPRQWFTAHWTGQDQQWDFRPITTSTSNYDVAALHIETDGDGDGEIWRLIGPTEPGPQHWGTGGEIAMWLSHDQGATWQRQRLLTANSPRNHSYVRRPRDAHPGFYAFWADGDADRRSASHLYFATQDGQAFQLPYTMAEDFAKPQPLPPPPQP